MQVRFMGLLNKLIETKTVEVAKEKGLAKDHATDGGEAGSLVKTEDCSGVHKYN